MDDATHALWLTDPGFSASLRALVARGVVRQHPRGTVLMQEGTPGDTLHIILSGRVQACSTDELGRQIVYGVYGPGELLGEMSLDGGPRSASVVTLEPTRCAWVTRQSLLAHIAQHPEFAMELLTRVIHRARLATRSARNLALLDAYGRLAALLDELACEDGAGRRVIRPVLTQQALAARVGCSREMISRLLKDLSAGGYVTREPGALVLHRALPSRW